MATKRNPSGWSAVKTRLAALDRAGLLELVHDLYAANKDNKAFLHARFGQGDDVLKPYTTTIARWLWPDVYKDQDTSVAKAKKAISDYKKAIGHPDGLAELMVFYCEQACGFGCDVGLQDEGYFDALVRMFEQALKLITTMTAGEREPFLRRLYAVADAAGNLGWGVGDDMGTLLAQFATSAGQ